MDGCDEFKRLWLMRRGGQVLRFHTEPFFRRQTVAEHTFGALLILYEIADNVTPNLVRALLLHDLGEQYTGDLPAPAGWRNPQVRQSLDQDERQFLQQFGTVTITDEERRLLEAADALDLCFTVLENLAEGRLDALSMVERLLEPQVKSRVSVNERSWRLYDEWRKRAQALCEQQGRVLRTLAQVNAWQYSATVVVSRVPGPGDEECQPVTKTRQPADNQNQQPPSPALPNDG